MFLLLSLLLYFSVPYSLLLALWLYLFGLFLCIFDIEIYFKLTLYHFIYNLRALQLYIIVRALQLYIIIYNYNCIILFSLHSILCGFIDICLLLHLLSTSQYTIISPLNYVLMFKVFKKRKKNCLILSHLFTTLLTLHPFLYTNVPSGTRSFRL